MTLRACTCLMLFGAAAAIGRILACGAIDTAEEPKPAALSAEQKAEAAVLVPVGAPAL